MKAEEWETARVGDLVYFSSYLQFNGRALLGPQTSSPAYVALEVP